MGDGAVEVADARASADAGLWTRGALELRGVRDVCMHTYAAVLPPSMTASVLPAPFTI